ncbi:hypothetical protein EMPS_10463 [Entomortierella parvispora]|uniref:AIG1-type G domain-containing protein n=1 Tax=Entomortierella parvispora TaxID=205924 RepID=A0A9P3HJX6_9FUNG|nr:hypothetical protein EMPS_10463 [Entomortierella parvispora]
MTPNEQNLYNKKIIFVGKMGTGKSSLTNMLVQGDLFVKNIREVSDSAASVTSEVKVVDGRDWTACDTVGLGELQGKGDRSVDSAMGLLGRVLEEGQRGFHYIAYVVQQGRLKTMEQDELFKLFKSTFQGAEANFVLVVTHCPNPMWATRYQEIIKQTFGDIPVITCDFPFDADDTSYRRKERLESLSKLEAQLMALPRSPLLPVLSMKETTTEAALQTFSSSLEKFLNAGKGILERVKSVLAPMLTSRR